MSTPHTFRKMNKNYNLELIRNVSFVFVILIHVTNFFCRGYDQISMGAYIFSLFLDTIARISVPCFFMISGALLLKRNEGVEKGLKRVLKFGIILIFWSIVYYFFNKYYMGEYYSIENMPFEPMEKHLWYLYVMVPIYIMLPFFQVLVHHMTEKQEKYFILLCFAINAVSYYMAFGNLKFYYDVPLAGDEVYVLYFFLGYYLVKYAKDIPISSILCFVITVACAAIITGGTLYETLAAQDHFEDYLEYSNPLLLVMGAFAFLGFVKLRAGHFVPKERTKKVIDTLSSCALGIYLVHIIFLDIYKHHMAGVRVMPFVTIPVLTIVLFLLSFAIIYIIRKIPGGKRIA